jgi:molecular chaperone Hsp33
MGLDRTLQRESDFVQPFQIEGHGLRGRFVRLNKVASEIVRKHDYPEPLARLLTETMTIAAALAAALKYEGVFTLQAKGHGPVKLLVADVTSGGDMRGYAQFDAAAIAAIPATEARLPRLLGGGYLAFTVDQGEHAERYQGIVALEGRDLVECIHHYFRQSEQLQAGLKLAVARADDEWQAGIIMLQRLPQPTNAPPSDEEEDSWRRAMILLASASKEDLIGPDPSFNDLLYRLFHEDGVRIFPGHGLKAQCRCSDSRVRRMLGALPQADLADLTIAGDLVVTCEFCNSEYRFPLTEITGAGITGSEARNADR